VLPSATHLELRLTEHCSRSELARVQLQWVGYRLSRRPEEGQLQLSKLTLTVPLIVSLPALPKRSQGPRQ
jgi:hypothetical protein